MKSVKIEEFEIQGDSEYVELVEECQRIDMYREMLGLTFANENFLDATLAHNCLMASLCVSLIDSTRSVRSKMLAVSPIYEGEALEVISDSCAWCDEIEHHTEEALLSVCDIISLRYPFSDKDS